MKMKFRRTLSVLLLTLGLALLTLAAPPIAWS